MASPNVELVERVVDAVNHRDADTVAQLVSDSFEWVTPVANPDATVYHGRAGVRQFFEDTARWASIQARVDDIHDLGNRALVLGELTWRGRDGGSLEESRPLASVIYFNAGAVSRIHTYRDANDAWVASGLGRPRY